MMEPTSCIATKSVPGKKTITKALLLSIPMMLFTALLLTGGKIPSTLLQQLALGSTYFFINSLFFLMVYTGKTYKYRSVFFIVASACFVLSFITNLIEVRGSMVLSAANMLDGDAPLCPLVIPMLVIPAALTQTIIFPGSMFASHAGIAPMIVLWLGISVAVGRGWCSWICFFGGMDEGFSRVCKKPKITTIHKKWTYLPHAVLLTIVLGSAATLSPVYCEWLCPFKAVTEYIEITSVKILLQTIIFLALFLALVVVLPILTGRRIQCGLFCPFASFQSFTNKLNIFDIRIDTTKCIHCKGCMNSCPTFSIDEASIQQGKTLLSCTKCGKCVDFCPTQAMTFHIKGTPVNVTTQYARLLFLYPAYIFGAVIGGGSICSALIRMFNLMTRGSFF